MLTALKIYLDWMKTMKWNELIKLLKTANSAEEIDEYRNEIVELIPTLKIMVGFDQKNHAHQFDLWMHSLHVVANLPRNLGDDMLYLAALFHDIGKPDCQCKPTKPNDTSMHYYGHPKRSMEIVRDIIIPKLSCINATDAKRLLYYVEYHDDRVSRKLKHINRHMKLASFEEFQNLMLLQVADAKAHILLPIIQERIDICSDLAGTKGLELYQIYVRQNKMEKKSE